MTDAVYLPSDEPAVVIGKIGAPHGCFGWLKIHSFTTPRSRIFHYQPWWIKEEESWTNITHCAKNTAGKNLLVKLTSWDDRDTVKALTNVLIYIARNQLPDNLDSDEYYWADLQGLTVTTTLNQTLGTVHHLIPTGANDVLVVTDQGREHLIPFIENVICSVDLKRRVLTVNWDTDL